MKRSFSAAAVLAIVWACSSVDAPAGAPCTTDAECAGAKCIEGACAEGTTAACNAAGRPDTPGAKRCDGEACVGADDCSSGKCDSGVCGPSADKKCGVGLPNPCADGEKCQQDADCATDYCATDVCAAAPSNVHEDGRRNGGETGKDCGGTATEKPCPAGEMCKTSADCVGVCNAQNVCDAPSATDGKKNQGETDIDCGGATAPPCALGKACETNDDCTLLACTNKKCVTPTETDGLKNGGETDVDCGGPGVSDGTVSYMPPRCKEGGACAAGSDCLTGGCNPGGKCLLKSCATAETAGIVTCGAKEAGDPAKAHESCCRSLPLPNLTTRRLDKYEITAGRFRTFLTKAGPNLRAWATAYIAANPGSQLAAMVAMSPGGTSFFPAGETGSMNLVAHMAIDIDSYNGSRGCYNGLGSYNANTYWQDATKLATYMLPPRTVARAESDQKPLNCAMPLMFMAFCAWDGGELASQADFHDAWNAGGAATTYPWGATDILRPNYNWCNGNPGTGGFNCQDTSLGNFGIFYEWPPNVDFANDEEPLIAAPGRFVNDATANKSGGESWHDLYGNLAEYTGDLSASTSDFCDFTSAPGASPCTRNNKPGETGPRYTNVPRVGIIGVSWEGHRYNRGQLNAFPITFQYGKFGGRCVRPVE